MFGETGETVRFGGLMSSDPRDLYRLRFGELGITAFQAAAWLGIHVRTYQRQEQGRSSLYGPLWRALALKAGYLGDIHPAWTGWRLSPRDGRLYPPGYRYGLSAGEILSMPYLLALVLELQRQQREWAANASANGEHQGRECEAESDRANCPMVGHNGGAEKRLPGDCYQQSRAGSALPETFEALGETDNAESSSRAAICP